MAINIPIYAQFNDKGLKDAEGAFQKFGSKAGDIAKKAALAFVAIGASAAVGAYKAIQAASDVEESLSKVSVVFGDQSSIVTKWSNGLAESFGISKKTALDAASTFQIFGKAAGLSGNDIVGFSTDMTELAADLASFNNTSPEDAIMALGAAFRGESEPMRRYGVMLSDVTLKAKAQELGLYSGVGTLKQSAKILAAQAIILEETSTAYGDFARTSDGLANKQRILKARLENLQVMIGQKLLPIFMKIVDFISNKVGPAFTKLTKVFEKDGLAGILREVRKQLPKLGQLLQNAVSVFGDWLVKAYPPALRAVLDLLYNLGSWLQSTGLPALADLLVKGAKAFWEWIEVAAPPAVKRLAELIGDLANWILDKGLPAMVDKLIVLGNALVDWIKPLIVPALKALGEFIVALAQWITGTALPKLAAEAVKLGLALIGWVFELAPKAIKGLATALKDIVFALPGLFLDLVTVMFDTGISVGAALLDGIKNGITAAAGFAGDVAKSLANAVISAFNFAAKKINDLIPNKIGSGLFSIDLPDNPIPRITPLASGGIVTSPTLSLIGEAGPEAVIPLDKMGGMGNNVTINVNGGDPQQVVNALRRYMQLNGSVPIRVS